MGPMIQKAMKYNLPMAVSPGVAKLDPQGNGWKDLWRVPLDCHILNMIPLGLLVSEKTFSSFSHYTYMEANELLGRGQF